jgi:hypothetical protein
MIEIVVNGKNTSHCPEQFAELSINQLKVFVELFVQDADLMFADIEGKPVVHNPELFFERQITMLYVVLGIDKKSFFKINPSQINDLLLKERMLDFLFLPNYTINKLTTIFAHTNLYAPINDFFQLSFEEFKFADDYFNQFTKKKNSADLDMLCAILYRPRKSHAAIAAENYNGDMREAFNKNKVESRLPAIKDIALWKKLSVYLWFSHCRKNLTRNYPKVFTKKESDSKLNWLQAAMSMAGGVINLDKILDMNVYLVFEELTRLIIQSEEGNK